MVSNVITTKYVLSQYRDKPEAEQPYLTFRFITRNERLKMQQHFSTALATEDEEKNIEAIKSGIAIALVGWGGYATPYDVSKLATSLDDVLLDMDYQELLLNLIEHISLSVLAKKKSLLMPQSTVVKDASVKVVAVETAVNAQA